jgi:hypothetical protein
VHLVPIRYPGLEVNIFHYILSLLRTHSEQRLGWSCCHDRLRPYAWNRCEKNPVYSDGENGKGE